MNRFLTSLAIAGLAFGSNANAQCESSCSYDKAEKMASCSTDKDYEMTMTTVQMTVDMANQDIVATAASAGQFNTLLAAAKAAGLVGALQGEGPITVFAPTDAAFAKLPKGTVDTLLRPENKDKLAAVLTYHVVPGRLMASDVLASNGFVTLNGQRVDISSKSGPMIDNANIVKTDITASNGVIHVIDRVILPADKNIVETADEAGSFGTLIAAAKAGGLVPALTGEGPITVFAPTDEAFAALPAGTVETLLKPENKDQLVAILTYHVVPGRVYAADALGAGKAETLQGSWVKIKTKNGQPMVQNANIVATDIDASNGVIHVIDRVILPE